MLVTPFNDKSENNQGSKSTGDGAMANCLAVASLHFLVHVTSWCLVSTS
jgi:hypothetical protein